MRKTPKSILLAAITALTAVAAHGAVIFQDNFTYSDGSLTNGSVGTWFYHSVSGTAELNVQSGQALVQGATGSDASANLSGAPYPAGSSTAALYAKFTVNFTSLPTAAGTYFAHFKDSGNGSAFRARVWASTTGAGSGF